MKLTPLDIHHKEFRNSLRGYNPEEVDDFLDEVADEFERLFKENIDLSEKLEAASSRVRAYADMERTLQNTMVAAQSSADDMRARAEAESARMVADAESKAHEIVAAALEEKQRSQVEHARLKAAEDDFRARFRRMLQDYMGSVEEPLTEAIPEIVAVEEPVAEAVTEPELFVEPEPEPEPAVSGTVVSLTLGETGELDLDDAEPPTLEVPGDFAIPARGPVGERDDDLDIEEID